MVVALLAEGVDRNKEVNALFNSIRVALLAEGVDRNPHDGVDRLRAAMSPSSRRAWIEICFCCCLFLKDGVALLAEGVDRNRLR